MLVSTPLLLWLAWSLAKPARKLKNAADEVAQGNLRQHPELEAGPQEFLAAGFWGVLFCYYSGYVFDKTIYLPNVNCNAPSKNINFVFITSQ